MFHVYILNLHQIPKNVAISLKSINKPMLDKQAFGAHLEENMNAITATDWMDALQHNNNSNRIKIRQVKSLLVRRKKHLLLHILNTITNHFSNFM